MYVSLSFSRLTDPNIEIISLSYISEVTRMILLKYLLILSHRVSGKIHMNPTFVHEFHLSVGVKRINHWLITTHNKSRRWQSVRPESCPQFIHLTQHTSAGGLLCSRCLRVWRWLNCTVHQNIRVLEGTIFSLYGSLSGIRFLSCISCVNFIRRVKAFPVIDGFHPESRWYNLFPPVKCS